MSDISESASTIMSKRKTGDEESGNSEKDWEIFDILVGTDEVRVVSWAEGNSKARAKSYQILLNINI